MTLCKFLQQQSTDNTSIKHRRPKIILLRDIVVIRAERNNFNLLYKTNLKKNDYQILDFLNKTHFKKTAMPAHKNEPCGIPIAKKTDILDKLKKVLSENRKAFWENLPSTNIN